MTNVRHWATKLTHRTSQVAQTQPSAKDILHQDASKGTKVRYEFIDLLESP